MGRKWAKVTGFTSNKISGRAKYKKLVEGIYRSYS